MDAPLVPEPPNPTGERRQSTSSVASSATYGEVIATLLRRPAGDNPQSPVAFKPPLSPVSRQPSGGAAHGSPQTPVQLRRMSSNDANLSISQKRTGSDIGPTSAARTAPLYSLDDSGPRVKPSQCHFARGSHMPPPIAPP